MFFSEPNIISKILQWNTIHIQRSLRNPHIQSSSSFSSSMIHSNDLNFNSNEIIMKNEGNNNLSSSLNNNLSTMEWQTNLHHQTLSNNKISTNIKKLTNNLNEMKKDFPFVKSDPFNRYLTSNDGNNSNNNNNTSSSSLFSMSEK